MSGRMCLVFIIGALIVKKCDSARILGVVPTPSYSHQIVFQPVWKELSLRGHQVTVLTTNPMYDSTLINLTEININGTYSSLTNYNFLDIAAQYNILSAIDTLVQYMNDSFNIIYSHSEVMKLTNNPNTKFDLVIFEALTAIPLALAWKFDCPAIGMTSMDAPLFFHQAMGNPSHPLVNPDFNIDITDTNNMTLMEELTSIMFTVLTMLIFNFKIIPACDQVNKQHLGNEVPSLYDLQKRISMLFLTTSPIFYDLRAVNPNTIIVGSGLHIRPPKPLPDDLKLFLDNAKEGVIYFSLGTNVKGNLLPEVSKSAIFQALGELPYQVLLKADWINMTIPKNFKIGHWMPQQDILRHPNIKLFVTQGGLQSLQEAVTNGVPIVGIPFFGDQFMNIQKAIRNGYGIRIDKDRITKESFMEAISTVLNDPKYRKKAEELKNLMYDEPSNSLEKIIWWTEYVLRHRGASHLQSNAAKLPFYKYLLIDILVPLILLILTFSYFLYKISRFMFGLIYNIYCRFKKARSVKKLKDT